MCSSFSKRSIVDAIAVIIVVTAFRYYCGDGGIVNAYAFMYACCILCMFHSLRLNRLTESILIIKSFMKYK